MRSKYVPTVSSAIPHTPIPLHVWLSNGVADGDEGETPRPRKKSWDSFCSCAFRSRIERLMKPRLLVRWFFTLCAAVVSIAGAAAAADVHVMISAGFYGVYVELSPAFERASGHHLVTTRGPSLGDSPEAIPSRLARGEAADVVILDGGSADELARRGLLQAASKILLARSQVGMVVRAGAAKPDISSVQAFRKVLLAVKSIAYSDSASGIYLSTTLFAKLGVAEQVARKTQKVRGPL